MSKSDWTFLGDNSSESTSVRIATTRVTEKHTFEAASLLGTQLIHVYFTNSNRPSLAQAGISFTCGLRVSASSPAEDSREVAVDSTAAENP